MEQSRDGWWQVALDAGAGTDYGFCLDGGEPLPDPRSPWQPDGVHGLSRTVDHEAFVWHDAGWRCPPLAELVIYELHVGTFTPEGTFEAAIARLEHIVELGATAVEIMPVAEFAGERGWGYDGVDLWAPHHAYGGPTGLKRLVDACHARGLAAILDVVYNHAGPEGNYLERFGPYLTASRRTPWGKAVNYAGRNSRPVRDFVVGNALMWLRDYHFDGLRLDAVHAIFDSSREHILAELAQRVHKLAPSRFLIAEEPRIDRRLLEYGLDAQWNDELHHGVHVEFTGEHTGYYYGYDGFPDVVRALLEPKQLGLPYQRFVAYTQTHDQVGNRAAGERLGHLVDAGPLRVSAALPLLSPFVPMLFMGEEWAAGSPFLFFSDHQDPGVARATSEGRMHEFEAFGWKPDKVPDPQARATFERSKLDWEEPGQPGHREVLGYYRSLLRLRRRLPAEAMELAVDDARKRLVMTRGQFRIEFDFAVGEVTIRE